MIRLMAIRTGIFIWAASALLFAGCARTATDGRVFTAGPRCPVHDVEMKETPVIYGYPDDDLLERAKAGEVILGGCIVGKDEPGAGYVCPVDKKVFYSKKTRPAKAPGDKRDADF